jgi:hypothetical protein
VPVGGWIVVYLVIVAVVIAGVWMAFTKAGAPGWASIIPIFNLYVLVKMAGKEGWWVILFFVPLVNFVVLFIVYIAVAERFGKSAGFGVGLVLLSFIFWPILGFGDARWQAEPVNI